MSSHYTSAEEINQLLAERAKIDAKLANFQSAAAPPASRPRHDRPQLPRQCVPRSFSLNGQSMSRTVSSGPGRHEAPSMSVSVSQRSAPTMRDTAMQHGSSTGSAMHLTKSSRNPPAIQPFDSRQDPSVMESWATGHDDPMTAYTFQPRQPVRSLSQRKPDLEQVDEIDSGMLPAEFFARSGTMPVLSVTPSPIDIPVGSQWRNPNHRGSISRRRSSFGITTPTTPSSAALTTGPSLASDMSRQSSFGNDVLGSFEMMNVHSNTSIFTDSNSNDERLHSAPFHTSSKLLASDELSLLLAGAGGIGEDSQFPLSFHDISGAQFQCLPSFQEDMRRSMSNESTASSMSATSRATAQLKRQIQLASSRPLAPAPKSGDDEVAMSREASHAMVSTKSNDGSENRPVAAITKAPYQRPKHERVPCTLCNEYPEGFRGQHELGRHHDRQHKDQVKKFVCIEPTDGVINPMYRPANSLAKCKACSTQKKKYGAYYNAAAHLRRAHFKPKQRGRGKSGKAEEKLEKRGGKGGGDWPPMSELKRWMKEVHENVTDNQQQDADDDEEDVDEDCKQTFDFDDHYPKLHDISNISSTNPDFDPAYLFGDATMLDAYPAPLSDFNTQGMLNMNYDNLATQGIDLSMHIDSSHSSFADSHFASMNDPMSFIDPFPQSFADQTIGPDSYHNFPLQM